MHNDSTREQQRILTVAAVLCALVGTALWAGPFLLRADLYADDAAQHIFWLYRYADPGLLPNDLTARYFSLYSSAPLGYRLIYATLAPYVDVLTFGEFLGAGLCLASVWLAALIGRQVASEPYRGLGALIGAVTVLCLIAQPSDVLTPLGLQRVFALPITLLFLWSVLAHRYAWLGVSWLLAALIYPVIIVVLGVAGAIVVLRELWLERRWKPVYWWLLIAGLGAIGLVASTLGNPSDIGPTVSGRVALAMPEFSEEGRLRLFFGTFSGNWLRNQLVGLGWSPLCLLVTACAAALAAAFNRTARLPAGAWILIGTGLVIWTIARLTLFTLYLPNRHTRTAFPAFAVAAISAAGIIVLSRVIERSRRPMLIYSGLSVVAVVTVVSVFLPGFLRQWNSPVDTDMEKAYAYLATLPKDALIAAHPDVADFVPLRSHRSVLASTETSLPFMLGYYEQLRPRLEASLEIAYASSWEELDAAAARYHVSVALSAPAVWEKETYYEPFRPLVAGLKARGAEKGFVLQHPPADRILFQSGNVYVVRVGRAGTPAE